MRTWTLLHSSNKGHRIFIDDLNRISLCDYSAANPHFADDGPLIVARRTTAEAHIYIGSTKYSGVCFNVPVTCDRDPDREAWASVGVETMRALQQHITFTVTRTPAFTRWLADLQFASDSPQP